jgi:ATPase subunit of ABC transporter with duplicated ATPase domains
MLTVSNISLSFGKRTLFEEVNLKFTPGNVYGLIGANGAGKSTFVKILSGDLDATSGNVSMDPGERMSVLKQNQNAFDDETVLNTVVRGNERLSQIIVDKKTEVYISIKGELRGPFVQTQIEPAVKAYRRQRDLSWIGFAVGWTLQAIQANVSAHLKGFDMTEDISLNFEPALESSSFGTSAGVKLRLNF